MKSIYKQIKTAKDLLANIFNDVDLPLKALQQFFDELQEKMTPDLAQEMLKDSFGKVN